MDDNNYKMIIMLQITSILVLVLNPLIQPINDIFLLFTNQMA